MKKQKISSACLALALAALWCLGFAALWRWDNKYTAALPALPGVNVLEAGEEASPRFLVDGWEYYPGRLLAPGDFAGVSPAGYLYAGEEPNFSAALGSPYGEATYRLTLRWTGEEPVQLSLWLPEIPSASRVYIGGALAGEAGSVDPYRPLIQDRVYSFQLAGETEIVIQAANHSHYYGGLYYPPAVGSPQAVAQMAATRMAVYGLLCFSSLAAALSTLGLWALGGREKDPVALLFGLLCGAFGVRVLYPFLRMLGIPSVRMLYGLEDLAGAGVLLCALALTARLSRLDSSALYRRAVLPAGAFFGAASVVFPLFILPYATFLINWYGAAVTLWKLLASLWMTAAAFSGLSRYRGLLLSGSVLFGLSQLISAVSVNRFEPIRGAWPEEYGGFLLAAAFAVLMARKGRDLSRENLRLTRHLQEEVERKTASLEAVVQERRQLLAQIVHDIKNPAASIRGYTDLILSQGVELDEETREYLSAIQGRMDVLEEHFQLLRDFSRDDPSAEKAEALSLNQLLADFHRRNLPDLEMGGQTFLLRLPREELQAKGRRRQLWRVLENLCYNALSFTPEGGQIILSLEREGDRALLEVADTGCGIAPEDLPHLFERGFSRRKDGLGSGLGLYIARSIVLEHGGEISAASRPGGGALFQIRLPVL